MDNFVYAGLQKYYSIESEDPKYSIKDPKFGSFIRSIFGLPYVTLDDLERAMKNIKKISDLLIVHMCKRYSSFDQVGYLKSICFEIPESRKNTPGDRNCMFHALADQSFFCRSFGCQAKNCYKYL